MERQSERGNRPTNPRRKTRSKMQTFKEAYLPILILALAVVVIVSVIVGISVVIKKPDSSGDPVSTTSALLVQEAHLLLEQAAQRALHYDYDGALEILEGFSGNVEDFPDLKAAIHEYTLTKHSMVTWTAAQVPNLSFHMLIADLDAALADPTYGTSGSNQYNRNFLTVDEFSTILKRLYDNGYVLVDLDDLYSYEAQNDSATYVEKPLLLPEGKKPLLLTETHCNYYSYMVDLDRDGQPDADGAGFASKLCWDNGFYNEMVTSDGNTVTGAFDMVPLLENFIQLYPDFSYKGARAILAFSGYDGIFGYRITSKTADSDTLSENREQAAALIGKLKEAGYTMACYTYDNIDYSVTSASEIKEDIALWQEHIAPIVGNTQVMVFAREADIGTNYENNQKFNILYQEGYRFFLGSTPFLSQTTDKMYVRHNRLSATASNLQHHADWFQSIFSTENLLDSRRNHIPK